MANSKYLIIDRKSGQSAAGPASLEVACAMAGALLNGDTPGFDRGTLLVSDPDKQGKISIGWISDA